MTNSSFGQNADTVYNHLVNCNLLNKNAKKEFVGLINRYENFTNSNTLEALYYIEFKKLTSVYPGFDTYVSFGTKKPKKKEQTKANLTLKHYLDNLVSCQLINNNIHSLFQEKVEHNTFISLLQLLPEIVKHLKHLELMDPEKILLSIEKINPEEVFGSNYSSLINDLKYSKIKTPIDLLSYMKNCVVINAKDFSEKPEEYLEEIHKKTSSVLNKLNFNDFKYDIVLDSELSDEEFKFYDVIASLKSEDKVYKQKSFYELIGGNKDVTNTTIIDQQEYYKIFNKILTDINSEFRLHLLSSYFGEEQVFGIVALTENQAELIRNNGRDYFSLSYENFKKGLTSIEIDNAILKYKEIGLINHLDSAAFLLAKEKISIINPYSLSDILYCFPDVIYFFDTELGNLENPYEEIIIELAKISHFEFNPKNISDNFDIEKNKEVIVEFTLNSQHYKKAFVIESDWIDHRFIEFIMTLPEKHRLNGKYYYLDSDGQGLGFIFLTEEQHNYLKEEKILNF